jgi:flagellar basal body-associated protein FliL
MKEEIENHINKSYEHDQSAQMKDVYVTNHEPRQKKFLTAS